MQNAANGFPQNGDAPDGGPDGGRLAEAIAATAALLRLAEGLAAAGRPVDLAGLDDRIGLLCAQALDLAPADGARLRGDLAALLRDLDALGVALRA